MLLLAGALLPALVLMVYVFRQDRLESEPIPLLIRLTLFGALACVPAALLEEFLSLLLEWILPSAAFPEESVFCFAFFVVAASEEGCKLFFLKKATWQNPNFDCRFDGIVYSVFVSLGFAALENVLYVFQIGPSILVTRGLLSVPGHLSFSVFMGVFYSAARQYEFYGEESARSAAMRRAFFVPLLFHGFYDYCLMTSLPFFEGIFFLFVVAMDVLAFRTLRRQARLDAPFERPFFF